MTTYKEFAEHLATVSGSSVTTSKLPAKPLSADDQWSVRADGAEDEQGGNILLWKLPVNIRVDYRHKRTSQVYDADAVLREALSTFSPTQSPSVLSKTLIPITDTDQDAEGRHTGSWQVKLTIITK